MTTTPFDAVISALEARRSGNPNAIRDMALIDAVEAYTGRQHMSFSIAVAFAEGLEAGKRDGFERAAIVAEGWPCHEAGDNYQTSGNGNFWDAGTNHDQGRIDAAADIRAMINAAPDTEAG